MGKKFSSDMIQSFGNSISEKMDNVADAIREEGEKQSKKFEEVNEKFSQQETINSFVLNDMSKRERKELYNMNSISNITDLEESERQFLVNILFTIANNFESINDSQRQFNRVVKNLLKISGVDPDADLSCVDNIDSLKDRKIVLQTVMEFLFLKNNDFSFFDSGIYDQFFEDINIKQADMARIAKNIESIFNAVGSEGLIDKYNESNFSQTEEDYENCEDDEDIEYTDEELEEIMERASQMIEAGERLSEKCDSIDEKIRENEIQRIVDEYILDIGKSNTVGWRSSEVANPGNPKRLNNVMFYIANNCTKSDLMGALDTSIAENGKAGIAFTKNTLCCKELGSFWEIPYSDMNYYISGKKLVFENSKKYGKGIAFYEAYLDSTWYNLDSLKECLDQITALFN